MLSKYLLNVKMSLKTDTKCIRACPVHDRRANDYIRAVLGENVFEPWVDVRRDDPATLAALEAEASEQGPE